MKRYLTGTRLRRAIAFIGAICCAATLGACLDDFFTAPPRETPASIVTLSDTSTGVSGIGFLAHGSVTYVSLAPGSVADGMVAIIRNRRTADTAAAAMTYGGFDPVGIPGLHGDTLEINVQGSTGTTTLLSVVPAKRRPTIVRTIPPRGKAGVPLNARMSIVFSEPMDRRTLSANTIRLMRGASQVSGETIIGPSGTTFEFVPNQLLEPGEQYEIRATTAIKDLDGDSLENPQVIEFVTGTAAELSSISTPQTALFMSPFNGQARTFSMTAARQADGTFTGTFSIFYPSTGVRASGRIVCFTVVDGRTAWMAGVIEESGNAMSLGMSGGWRVTDNGPADGGVADQLSLIHWFQEAWPISADEFCASTPEADPDQPITLYALAAGDIVIGPEGAVPPRPADGGMSRIAFAASPRGGIRTIRADGFDGRVLTSTEGDWNPAWSPDGSQIAFDRALFGVPGGPDIWVMKKDGSELRRLTSGTPFDAHPAWSPDGKRMAFYRDGRIFTMNAVDGSNPVFLADGDNPKWSPDGQRIAFWSSQSGARAVYTVKLDRTDVRKITHDSLNASNPTWSHDGARIAFQGARGIYIVSADGSDLRRIAFGGQTPVWSPDGKMIVYEWFGLNVITADGAGLTRRGPGYTPAWSVGAMPPPPVPTTSITILDGDGQVGVLGETLPKPMRVRVTRGEASVAGQRVNFVLQNGYENGPRLSTNNATTDADGIAAVTLTMGNRADDIGIVAQVTDGSALTPGVLFSATAMNPADGMLDVSIRTSGTRLDTTGFTLCLESATLEQGCSNAISIGPNDKMTVTMPAGAQTLYLMDVAVNCTVADSNPRSVTIPPLGTLRQEFGVECFDMEELVPYRSSGYRYKQLQDSAQSSNGFEKTAFDDLLPANGFAAGDAAFGSPTGENCELADSVRTNWDVETDLLVRKTFALPAGASRVRIGLAIDNDAQLFVNGVDITAAAGPGVARGFARHGGCATHDSFVFSIPAHVLNAGANLIAVRARDQGVESFFDLRVVLLKP